MRLDSIKWFKEVVCLSAGQSFGELALINDAPRAATIHCMKECYFAVLGRSDYEKVLKRLEQRQTTKAIDFFLQVPFLSHWTRTQIWKLIL